MLDDLQETIDQSPNLKYLFIGIVVVLVGLVGWLFWGQLHSNVKRDKVATITLGDGQNQVIVRRDGNVTIKTPYGTFNQKWDPEKIKKFFAQIDNLDFESLSGYLGSDLAIKLTFNDHPEKIIKIEDVPADILQALQDALDEVYNVELADKLPFLQKPIDNWPNSGNNQDSSSFQNSITNSNSNAGNNTNTGNNSNQNNNVDNNPWNQGLNVDDPEVFSCDGGTDSSGHKIIISNTVCED